MRLSLIGMSGSGKSYWAEKLAEHDFKCFYCDDLIAEKLVSELMQPDGTIMELGEWMGFPYDTGYKERESKYLSAEKAVLSEVLNHIERHGNHSGEHFLIDSTGSVIYTGEKLLRKLRQNTTVVHLETPPEILEQMLTAYLSNRRPVLWRHLFSKAKNESNAGALARCYPKLLSEREHIYEQYADVSIDYYQHSKSGFGVREFLKIVSE